MQPSAQADDFKNIMKRLPLVAESLDSRGLYIYDDGFGFVIWFGRMLSPDIARNLLGADFAAELSKVRSLVGEAILMEIDEYYMFYLLCDRFMYKGY